MKNSFIFCLFLVSVVFSSNENNKIGFDISVNSSVNIVDNKALFIPFPSVSICFIRDKGLHEISSELIVLNYYNSNKESFEIMHFGLNYSFCFKIINGPFHLGPIIGFWPVNVTKTIEEDEYYTESHEVKNALYFSGLKFGFLLSDKPIKFKLFNRLLAGFANYDYYDFEWKFSIDYCLSVGLLFAF